MCHFVPKITNTEEMGTTKLSNRVTFGAPRDTTSRPLNNVPKQWVARILDWMVGPTINSKAKAKDTNSGCYGVVAVVG